MIKTIKISDKGQIAIPQSIREQLNLNRGDNLLMIQIDGKIVLQKTNDIQNEIEDKFKDISLISENSLKDIWDNKEDDIWEKCL